MGYVEEDIDPLTRLPGRAALMDRLGDEIARSERYGVPLSLLLADVNGFRALTRARGPAAADAALCRLALALLSTVRDSDMVARVGADKFAVLLPDTSNAGAMLRGERLVDEVAASDVSAEETPLFVTVSVGVATFAPGLAESGALLAHAEEALLDAKRMTETQGQAAVSAFPEDEALTA